MSHFLTYYARTAAVPVLCYIRRHIDQIVSSCKVYRSSIVEGGMPLFSLCLLSSSQTIVKNPHSLVKATEPHCCQTREEPSTYVLTKVFRSRNLTKGHFSLISLYVGDFLISLHPGRHSSSNYLALVACLWFKCSRGQDCHFHQLLIMRWSACHSNLVNISSLDLKWQGPEVGRPVFQLFYEKKLKTSQFKVWIFWGQWRYHDEIQITSS